MLLWGILAAVACALCSQVAGLCKHRGANAVPAISLVHPLRALRILFSSGWFTIGMILAVIAFAFHAAAMAFAPISWVQAVLATGVVALAVIADRLFGYSVGRRQWAGIGLVGVGLAMFALTVPAPPEHGHVTLLGVLLLECVLMLVGLGLLKAHSRGVAERHGGMVLGAVAGIFTALGDVAVKAGLSAVGNLPLILVALVCAVGGFFAAARGMQLGSAVPVLTAMSLAANVVCILSGWIAFGERLPSDVVPAVVHLSGFVLIVLAAWLIPGARYEVGRPAAIV